MLATLTPADLSSSALSFVLPIGTAAPTPAADGRPHARRRGRSAAMEVAETAVSGVIKQAGPPGAIGVRTLWAMMLGLLALWILQYMLT